MAYQLDILKSMHDIVVIQTKPGWCLESLTMGAVSFNSQFYFPLKLWVQMPGAAGVTKV